MEIVERDRGAAGARVRKLQRDAAQAHAEARQVVVLGAQSVGGQIPAARRGHGLVGSDRVDGECPAPRIAGPARLPDPG